MLFLDYTEHVNLLFCKLEAFDLSKCKFVYPRPYGMIFKSCKKLICFSFICHEALTVLFPLSVVKAMCGHRWEWQLWPSSPEPWLSGFPLSCPGLVSHRGSTNLALMSPATPQTGAAQAFNLTSSNDSRFNPFPLILHSFSYIFGAVTVATGILGGAVGTTLSRTFRDKVPYADPLICGVGMLGSVPCIFIIIFVAASSIPATYVRNGALHLFSSFFHLCQA